jgi:hypothetical protein
VLKGYATSASVILTGILSAALFGTALDVHFLLAVVNVTCSIALYGSLSAADGAGGPETRALLSVKSSDVLPASIDSAAKRSAEDANV